MVLVERKDSWSQCIFSVFFSVFSSVFFSSLFSVFYVVESGDCGSFWASHYARFCEKTVWKTLTDNFHSVGGFFFENVMAKTKQAGGPALELDTRFLVSDVYCDVFAFPNVVVYVL